MAAAKAAKHVLVANDEANMLRLFLTHLERAGFHVSGAENGLVALEQLQSEPGGVDLLITDALMPEMDGFELVRAVRGLPALASCPGFPSGHLCRGYA